MPTFLTTSKMNPALAARVEDSVEGRASDPNARARRNRRITAVARVVLVVGLTWGLWSGFGAWRRAKIELESARTSLLQKQHMEASLVRDEQKKTGDHVEAWLVRLAGPYDGDLVDPSIKSEKGLAPLFEERGMIYLRGALEALAKPSAIPGAAGSSVKDTLVYCLAEPPPSRAEAPLLDKVRTSYGTGTAVETATPRVRRLGELLSGMPFLSKKWADDVRFAQDRDAVARLQRDFDKAPIAHAREAAKASLLLVAIDEPGNGPGPTELDGERPHAIRLFLVDLTEDKVLLRARKAVDPAFVSVGRRPHYARGMDSCAFAFDVVEDVKKK